jgi:hypothetical protein
MPEVEPGSFSQRQQFLRNPQQEIVDLLAVALLRLRVASVRLNDDRITGAESVVAMSGHQSVNVPNR